MQRRSLDGDIWLKLDAFRPFDPFGVGYPIVNEAIMRGSYSRESAIAND
jgi:hypothetical protein